MTRDETKGLIMIIQASFPNYRPVDKTVTVNQWFRQLQEYDYNAIMMALDAYIATETTGFAPSVGQLIDQLAKIKEREFPSEDEAFAMYLKAVSRGSHSQEEFDKLPPIMQKAVGDPYNLFAAGMSNNFNVDVAKSNFLKSYRRAVKEELEYFKYPTRVQQLIKSTENKLIENRTS